MRESVTKGVMLFLVWFLNVLGLEGPWSERSSAFLIPIKVKCQELVHIKDLCFSSGKH